MPDNFLHIRYQMLWGPMNNVDLGHPQENMKKLGITYQHATPHGIADIWIFWNCDNLPKDLPSHLEIFNADPREFIGYGLDEELALKLYENNPLLLQKVNNTVQNIKNTGEDCHIKNTVKDMSEILDVYLEDDVKNNMSKKVYYTLHETKDGFFQAIHLKAKCHLKEDIYPSIIRLAKKINDLYKRQEIFEGFLVKCVLIKLNDEFVLSSYPVYRGTPERLEIILNE